MAVLVADQTKAGAQVSELPSAPNATFQGRGGPPPMLSIGSIGLYPRQSKCASELDAPRFEPAGPISSWLQAFSSSQSLAELGDRIESKAGSVVSVPLLPLIGPDFKEQLAEHVKNNRNYFLKSLEIDLDFVIFAITKPFASADEKLEHFKIQQDKRACLREQQSLDSK